MIVSNMKEITLIKLYYGEIMIKYLMIVDFK